MSATTTNASAPPRQTSASFTFRQRIMLWLVTAVGYLAIRLIGPTLRFTLSFEDGAPPDTFIDPAIMVFWHRCVFPGTYFYRKRGIAVMTSQSFDGEYIARIIERLGYAAVRGSSSRGGVRALLGMHKIIDQGHSVGFTIDGPRGPLYVAKPGPVLLARNTRVPIYPFYIAVEKAWVLKSWDQFMIPRPFSRALLRIGKLMYIPPEADTATLASYHAEMQAALDRLRVSAEQQLPGSEAKQSRDSVREPVNQ